MPSNNTGLFKNIQKSINENKSKYKTIFAVLGYVVGLISGVTGIIDHFKDDSEDPAVKMFINAVLIFSLVISLIAIVFAFLFVRTDYRSTFSNSMGNIFISLHKIIHEIRNCTSNLKSKNSNRDYLKSASKNICDGISELYNKLFDANSSVCIKLTNTDSIANKEIDKWKLETIARSNSTDIERSAYDSKDCYIKDNSDFLIIVSDKYNDSFFASPDLTNINKKFIEQYKIEYRNSRGKDGYDFLKYYKSTIVVPIRIKRENIDKIFTIPEDVSYHLLGFLCIDTNTTFKNNEIELFNAGIEVAKSLADSLYHLYEGFLVHEIREKALKEN